MFTRYESEDIMIIDVKLGENSYEIVVERNCIDKASELINLDRKVLVVTDSGVPEEYSKKVASQCKSPYIVCIQQGEKSKNFDNYKLLLETMLKNEFTRTDAVVAVGGGVVGDLSGFVASTYMRGVDFYNIPTTVLSQVDSSVGGKTAIDFGSYKNTVGSFYQPKKVLVDLETLKTLPERQISNGLTESVKISMTSDKELFDIFENGKIEENLDKIIIRSIELKRDVVEEDEKETGLRKVLNFGHTIGHAIESCFENSEMYHGECVSVGMIPMCDEKIRERLKNVLKSLSLPTEVLFDTDKVCENVKHDKKFDGNQITVIKVNEIGSFVMKKISKEEMIDMINNLKGGEEK